MTTNTNIQIIKSNNDEKKDIIKKRRSNNNKKEQKNEQNEDIIINSSVNIVKSNTNINNTDTITNKDFSLKDIKKDISSKDVITKNVINKSRNRNRNKGKKNSVSRKENVTDSVEVNNIDNNKVVTNRKRGSTAIKDESIINNKINDSVGVVNNNHSQKSYYKTSPVIKENGENYDLNVKLKIQSQSTNYKKKNEKMHHVASIAVHVKRNNENKTGSKIVLRQRKLDDARLNKNSQKSTILATSNNNNNNDSNNGNNRNQRKPNEKERRQNNNNNKNINKAKNNKIHLNKDKSRFEYINRDYTVESIQSNITELSIEEATLKLQLVGNSNLNSQNMIPIRSGSTDTTNIQQKKYANSIKNQRQFSQSPTSSTNLKATAKEFLPSSNKEFESNENEFQPQHHPFLSQHIISHSNLNQMNSMYTQQIQQPYNIYEYNPPIIYVNQDGSYYQQNEINNSSLNNNYPSQIINHQFYDSPKKNIQINSAKSLSPRAKEFSPGVPPRPVNINLVNV